MTEDRNARPEPIARSPKTCRPDAAWIAGASHREFRSALTDEERKTRRDWGLYVIAFYGFVTVTFSGFAVFALSRDSGNRSVIAHRSTRQFVLTATPVNPSSEKP